MVLHDYKFRIPGRWRRGGKDALDSKGGFTWVLAGLKALMEHNLELNAIADAFPKGLKGH